MKLLAVLVLAIFSFADCYVTELDVIKEEWRAFKIQFSKYKKTIILLTL